MNKELLPAIDFSSPSFTAPPADDWTLQPLEQRDRHPEWRPPLQRPVKPTEAPTEVPTWVVIVVVLCALYAVARHYGTDIDCSREAGSVTSMLVDRPAPWHVQGEQP